MEDVLEVYRRPYDPKRPQICIDETSKQLLEHTRIPVPATVGTLLRVDDEYKRCGTANIFLRATLFDDRRGDRLMGEAPWKTAFGASILSSKTAGELHR